jgi:hypothetical protein
MDLFLPIRSVRDSPIRYHQYMNGDNVYSGVLCTFLLLRARGEDDDVALACLFVGTSPDICACVGVEC